MMNQPRSRGRAAVTCGTAVAIAVLAASAQAQVTQPTDPGVMSFPNVRVISAPSLRADESIPPAAASGVLAFIDPQTGALTEPTQAQFDRLHAIDQDSVHRKARGASATLIHGPGGAIGARLGKSYRSYILARRDATSHFDLACIDGEEKAMSFLEGRFNPHPKIGNRREEVLK
jgi:hypothetical protein